MWATGTRCTCTGVRFHGGTYLMKSVPTLGHSVIPSRFLVQLSWKHKQEVPSFSILLVTFTMFCHRPTLSTTIHDQSSCLTLYYCTWPVKPFHTLPLHMTCQLIPHTLLLYMTGRAILHTKLLYMTYWAVLHTVLLCRVNCVDLSHALSTNRVQVPVHGPPWASSVSVASILSMRSLELHLVISLGKISSLSERSSGRGRRERESIQSFKSKGGMGLLLQVSTIAKDVMIFLVILWDVWVPENSLNLI